MEDNDLEKLLEIERQKKIISQLESSGGKNLKHKTLTSGPNKGQTAGGAYGIVPASYKDFINQSMKRNIGVDPDLLVEMDKPHQEITKKLNENRELDDKAAQMALTLLNEKYRSPEKAALAWRTGHNRSDEEVESMAKTHPYVQKYRELAQDPSLFEEQQISEINPIQFQRIRKLLGVQDGND